MLTTPGLLLPLVLVPAPSQVVMPQVVSALKAGSYHQTLVMALTLTLLVPLASLIAPPVLPRSVLLPTTSLMPGASGMVSLTVLTPTAIIGRVPSTPMIVGAHTPFGLITPMSPQPTPVVAMTASPYAASLLPK